MSQRLPVFINPEHVCNRGLITSGTLQLEAMERLKDRLVAPYGSVKIDLTFYKEGKSNKVSGTITGEMVAQCQRCLEGVPIKVNREINLVFIESDAETELLLPDEEPYLANEGDVLLADIIEDELELSLPMIVMHDDSQCENSDKYTREDARDNASESNPFDVLADLKK